MEANAPTDPGSTGRVKKTRRRLRLSCVECTKRRQKCDRNRPCGLCKSRNVAHLCRWENVPVARPAPARPPGYFDPPSSAPVNEGTVQALSERMEVFERVLEQYTLALRRTQADPYHASTVQALSARMAVFERALEHYTHTLRGQAEIHSNLTLLTSDAGLYSPHHSPSSSYTDQSSPSQGSSFSSPEPVSLDEKKPIVDTMTLLSPKTCDTIAPLVPLSVGHQREYLGLGSAFGPLRSICKLPWQLQDDESNTLFIANDFMMSLPYSQIIEKIPRSPAVTTLLLKAYTAHSNWYFGLPESWLAENFSQMWDGPHYSAGPATLLSPYWVSLFFALGAVTPRDIPDLVGSGVDSADHYFRYSMAALQAADNMYEDSANSPALSSFVDGTIFGCLAVPILARCLAERNRLSDAWKLLGRWIRVAESIGLHCDPAGYDYVMTTEGDIMMRVRRLAWCNLVTWDRFYSLMLGRSHMGTLKLSDITIRVSEGPSKVHENQVYLSALVHLSTLAAEVNENCLRNVFPKANVTRDIDTKLEQWHGQLPQCLRIRPQYDGGTHIRTLDSLNLQRHVLHSWYLYSRMKVHVNYLIAQESFPDSSHFLSRRDSPDWHWSSCVTLCTQLIGLHCDTLESLFAYPVSTPLMTGDGGLASGRWSSESLLPLFEATIALVKVSRTASCEQQMNIGPLHRAYGVFNHLAMDPSGLAGKLPSAVIQILSELLQNLGPQLQASESSSSTPQSGIIYPPKLDLDISDIPGLDQDSNQEIGVNSNNQWSSMPDPDWFSNITPTTQRFDFSPRAP